MARKILLADDSVTAQNMGRKILADAGYEVITVNNGSAALKKIGEQKPDLIVLDVYMPGYSGLEVCQRLKEVAETSRIPILLTVGKLEPFKPDEARRVRADGYIVKPFEASELLSALSKLEDKVVPRAESSKPGRFARATAAIEESRYDKSMAIEEDDGWKSRIAFPKKKEKEKVVEPPVEDPSVYAPVSPAHKDLRSIDAPKPAPSAPAREHEEEERLDLSALAPPGLPKDITAEEIAALAAAAAQVQGKFAEETESQSSAAEMAIHPTPIVQPFEAEAAKEKVAEAKFESRPLETVHAPEPEPTPVAPAATFAEHEIPAEQPKPEKVEAKEPEPEVAATPAAVMAAIANLETEAVQTAGPGSGSWSPSASQKADEPTTMAVSAPAYSGPAVSRWTAVAVALAPEDAAISLELEMQKAYAAYAAADAGHAAVAPAIEASVPTPTAGIEAAPVEASVGVENAAQEVVAPVPAIPAPEAAQSMSEVANVATDAISAAVAELESVAAAYEAEKAASYSQTPEAEKAAEPAAVPETPQMVESKTEPTQAAETVAPAEEAKDAVQLEAASVEELKKEETAKIESQQAVDKKPATEESKEKATSAEPMMVEPAVAVATEKVPFAETSVAAPAVEAEEEHADSETVSEEQGRTAEAAVPIQEEPAVPVPGARKAGGVDDMAKRESETAAAWASWRKIRETGDNKSHSSDSKDSEETSSSKDAAMAVAVGAEHSPEEATSGEADAEISSIVDSVLEDLRPKIAEEIARKLRKKK